MFCFSAHKELSVDSVPKFAFSQVTQTSQTVSQDMMHENQLSFRITSSPASPSDQINTPLIRSDSVKFTTPGEHFGLLLEDAGINRINRYNPQNLKEICAFVTIACLTNSSLDEFARMANFDRVTICLTREELLREHGMIGIAYHARGWGMGHCVVAEIRNGSLRFICYQNAQGERDLTNHFRQAEWWGVFWFTDNGFGCQGSGFRTPVPWRRGA
ncbi:uncharacterized protein RAG0_11730 [Rhynchosporium agropyri]|uniref:Uncharacterized protein n=1 Tax=Rhynchosporium agropyri TaxID=914238 RepID=A0A1E1L599_9HELO|nr:uncharacterized protein RAG0_11730 [Rhynchosporium agropyri]